MTVTKAGVELTGEQYSQDSETYRFEYDSDKTSASMAVVAAVSEVTETDPAAMEPLQETIDTDALNRLLLRRDGADGDIKIRMTVEDYAVTVYSYGVVTVVPDSAMPRITPEAGVSQE